MNIDTHEAYVLFISTLVLFALGTIMLGRFMIVLSNNQTSHELQLRQIALEYEKGLMSARLEMQELTFQQIAQEIHDNIKPALVLSNVNLQTLNPAGGSEEEKKIRSSIAHNKKALNDLGDLSLLLNADWIRGMGLINALEKEIDKLHITGLFNVEPNISQNKVVMDAERELLVFRIVQEVFNNIVRHSGAKKISFTVLYNPDHLLLTIDDDGKGFDVSAPAGKGRGTGLNNIRSRAKVLQAHLTIDSTPGTGTTVVLSVPYISPPIPHSGSFIKKQQEKQPDKFNILERVLLRHAYLPTLALSFLGFSLFTFFLEKHRLLFGFIALSVLLVSGVAIARKKNINTFSQTAIGKKLLVQAKPSNLIVLIVGFLVFSYAIWMDDEIIMGAGGIIMLAGSQLNSKKARQGSEGA